MPLDRPTFAALATAWTVQPVALAFAVVLAALYAVGVRRARGRGKPWPARRIVWFALGLALLVWVSSGFLGAYAGSLYWVWTTQTLVLWLGVPLALLAGRPVLLADTAGTTTLRKALLSRPARAVANPLVGPALVPLLSGVLFFGPVAGWAIATPAVGWVLQTVLIAVGMLMALPLVDAVDESSSLAVGLALAIGSFELVLDALPGVILRLHTSVATGWFAHRDVQAWRPAPLHDQQVAGAILWCVAEVIDLPFLVLVFRRWLRADARDAARVDAVLEAERVSRSADRDVPWWLSDPTMRDRIRRPD